MKKLLSKTLLGLIILTGNPISASQELTQDLMGSSKPTFVNHGAILQEISLDIETANPIQSPEDMSVCCNSRVRKEFYWIAGILTTGSIAAYLIYKSWTAPQY